ncbi:MAG: YggS family pyridoxal phosphate-dependent enzyme [Flavobacteriaceae bacterium]|nr:YggS family pyridoxal phosphate-dependent enzyme [Flavobacteriaceae bacterium]
MPIQENYELILQKLPAHVQLIAVSKTQPIDKILELYHLGHRDFGENKVQEMIEKYEKLPQDIRWHMIGHVQSNKIKFMAEFVHLIHGIDKVKRLNEVQKHAQNAGRIQDVLLQIHIAQEETKFGMNEQEARQVMELVKENPWPNVNIKGLMGMATFTENLEQIQKEFQYLNQIYSQLQKDFQQIQILSMGMSGDFEMAIEQGSNMIRVGSAIFGKRNY